MRISFLFLLFLSPLTHAQDLPYAKKVIATLASPEYWGRGYTHDGMKKAADFIRNEVTSYGLTPLDGKNFFQAFQYPVNTFPGIVRLKLNDQELVTGEDYIVAEDSPSMKGSGSLTSIDATHFQNQDGTLRLLFEDKLTWSVAGKVADTSVIKIDKKKFKTVPTSYEIEIQNQLIPDFHTQNIAAVVRGTEKPDSYIVMSAHYDHLGGMGEHAFFPGANDNASGVSMLLGLAKYYQAHPQPLSMVFLFFAGEEAGLLGSHYFVTHPLIPLSKIKFLMNFDMVGTGDLGATVVNATVYPQEFKTIQDLNAKNHYFTQITARGKAPISDHYWFTENGVPAFFMYTWGGPPFYHDVFDRAETLPMSNWIELFKMMLQFNSAVTTE